MNPLVNQCTATLPQLTVDDLVKKYTRERARERWTPIYQNLLEEAERRAEPAAVCQEFHLAEVPELNEWLPPQTFSVILGVCTLGAQFDAYVSNMIETDLISAVVLNEISLALINGMTRNIHAVIRSDTLARGLKAGAAYRPGVGRWPIATQEVVFARVATDRIGVTLDESLLMRPVKSTSMIIPVLDKGLAPKA